MRIVIYVVYKWSHICECEGKCVRVEQCWYLHRDIEIVPEMSFIPYSVDKYTINPYFFLPVYDFLRRARLMRPQRLVLPKNITSSCMSREIYKEDTWPRNSLAVVVHHDVIPLGNLKANQLSSPQETIHDRNIRIYGIFINRIRYKKTCHWLFLCPCA